MTDKPPPPRRHSSITVAIDRSKLPPISARRIEAAAETYPDLPPDWDDADELVLSEMAPDDRATLLMRRAAQDTPTGESCPACATCAACRGSHVEQTYTGYARCAECLGCTFCSGEGWVTVERAAEWRVAHGS